MDMLRILTLNDCGDYCTHTLAKSVAARKVARRVAMVSQVAVVLMYMYSTNEANQAQIASE